MEYDEMFTVLSMCFAPVGQDEWKQLIDGPLWSDFLTPLGAACRTTTRSASRPAR